MNFSFLIRPGTSDERIVRDIYTNNDYRFPEDMSGMTVVDIGGHIGSATILCAERGARVFTYEPVIETFELLKANVLRFSQGSVNWKVCLFNKAVGIAGTRKLYIHSNNCGAHSLFSKSEESRDTEVVSFESVVSDIEKIDYLKLDCEGAEVEIIPDIINGLHSKIENIVAEIHTGIGIEENLAPMLEKLNEFYTHTPLHGNEHKWTRK